MNNKKIARFSSKIDKDLYNHIKNFSKINHLLMSKIFSNSIKYFISEKKYLLFDSVQYSKKNLIKFTTTLELDAYLLLNEFLSQNNNFNKISLIQYATEIYLKENQITTIQYPEMLNTFNKTPISAQVDTSIYDSIVAISDKNNIAITRLIEIALYEFVENHMIDD